MLTKSSTTRPNPRLQRTPLRAPLSRKPLGSRILAVGVVVCLFTVQSPAAPSEHAGPPLPYLDWGACPFECCTYREWRTVKAVTVLQERRRKSSVSFLLKPGDRVVALTGVVVTR